MRAKRGLIGIHVLLLGILACNLQGGQGSEPDLPGTITAQALTLQAATETPPSPTQTALVGVEVSVTSNTNCRTGPAQAFDLMFTAEPGQKFKVVGKNTPTGYWIVENPAGGGCWLWGQFALVTGDTSILPEYPAPGAPTPQASKTPKPTATTVPTLGPSAPADPSNFAYARSCAAFTHSDGVTPMWREDITFSWDDNSNNEDGFKLYAGSTVLQTLPPNAESTYDTRTYSQGTGGPLFDNYQLVAFNGAGGSFGGAVDVPRCP